MIKIMYAYPDLMNVYGDYANVLLLQKRLACAGYDVAVSTFSVCEDISLTGCDLLYLGGGTEGALMAALKDIALHADEIQSFAAFGGNILATGNAMMLLGRSITPLSGETVLGVDLLELDAIVQPRRRYAEYLLSTPLSVTPVLGALNTSLDISGSARPLFTVDACTEKADDAVAVGAIKRNVCATQLTGPLLVRNPALLDAYAQLLIGGAIAPCEELWYRHAVAGYESALATLKRETGR